MTLKDLYKFILFGISFLFIVNSNISAQYFGRNKVQYEDFDFKVLETEHFQIYYYPSEKKPVYDAAFMLERWYKRLKRIFRIDLNEGQPIILYANHPDFQQTNVITGIISQGVGGVTEGLENRIVIPLTGVYEENDHVLGHELVHAFQYTIMRRSSQGIRSGGRVPLWMVEGMAEYLSIGHVGPLTAMWMRDAVLNNDLPSIDEVSTNQKYFPYRYGHAIWSYIGGQYGDTIVVDLFSNALNMGLEAAVQKTLNSTLDSLSGLWQSAIREKFTPQIRQKAHPNDVGQRLIIGGGGVNLSPVISPNGKYVTFLSQRELFSLDMYMANVETGEIITKLVSSTTDEHFDALRFMNSSGSWSPDSKNFAFVIQENGDNKIAIVDVSSKDIIRKISSEKFDAITHLAFSNDGSKLALSATNGGISDLFIIDLESERISQLTEDLYAEIMPSWSPDDSKLLFSTDRGENADYKDYIFSKMSVGIYDFDTGEINLISFGEGVKHINPYMSQDGNRIYFISDPDGVSNLYYYSLHEERFYKVTNIATGISGLTELSPAMSYSYTAKVFTLNTFNDRNYFIHTLDANNIAAKPYEYSRQEFLASVFLPEKGGSSSDIVDDYLSTRGGLILADTGFSYYDYTPSLNLVYIGQTSVGIAVDRFGAGVGGGASFLWSDLLGNHQLAAVAQVNGGFKDIGAETMYVNRDNRWNWGVALGHIPYLSARMFTDNNSESNTRTLRLEYYRTFIDRINGILEYPLSTNRRVEFGAGFTRVSFDVEADIVRTNLAGFILSRETRNIDAPSGLNLFSASTAYVGDYSFFGFTSPIQGSRYRFEAEPTLGTLQYVTFLADYRKYFFLSPFTIAMRAYHLGRYFGDADNNRLTPLILGYQTWVRGYDINSYDLAECTRADGTNGCPEIDRLIGSRVGVANLELRIPLFGVEQFGLINFPYLPTEISLFADGGVAWTKDEDPEISFETNTTKRVPVFSTGIAARINLFGYIVGQIYYVYPFQRPEKGAHFGFVMAPGW